jgi:hypothetical protein
MFMIYVKANGMKRWRPLDVQSGSVCFNRIHATVYGWDNPTDGGRSAAEHDAALLREQAPYAKFEVRKVG